MKMRVKERIYSLLLLLVLTFSIGGLSAQHLIHCHHHSDHNGHHHCESKTSECEGHTSALKHSCAVEQETVALEYIVSNRAGSGVVKISSITMLFVQINTQSNEYVVGGEAFEFDRWRQYDLYLGFSPSLGLLRAPPALI